MDKYENKAIEIRRKTVECECAYFEQIDKIYLPCMIDDDSKADVRISV
ncbi:10668_t:CDS:2 [Funneliformis caledonium]|uniref:10668_t:CDS:1 n=1 Tax=Funneliformis caledonium TaxID=1117310 RepID=A0A9N9E8N8_9GLOM|nr:10668_t:CDS:2 [Funneliformis caledonium]